MSSSSSSSVMSRMSRTLSYWSYSCYSSSSSSSHGTSYAAYLLRRRLIGFFVGCIIILTCVQYYDVYTKLRIVSRTSTQYNIKANIKKPRQKYAGNQDGSQLHILFSTSCTQKHLLLLTSTLQYTATQVGQKGPMTQIISGCTEEQKLQILQENEKYPPIYYDYRLHFTPSYSPHPEPNITDDYLPYNKPFALRHYLLHGQPAVQHEILACIDADFLFFKPLEVNTGRNITKYYKGSRDKSTVTDTVKDGIAIAQDWVPYLGSGWYQEDEQNRKIIKTICQDQPCLNVTKEDALEYYTGTGPPYIMTRKDMLKFVDDYCHFTVEGRKFDKGWMTEMLGYAMAAANHQIKHTIVSNLGITHPDYEENGRENWSFLEEKINQNPCKDLFEIALPRDPPVGIHYFQAYGLFPDGPKAGGPAFYKHDMPQEIIECDSMLIQLPSIEKSFFKRKNNQMKAKRHEIWTQCSLIKTINQVLILLKEQRCPVGFNTYQGIALEKKPDKA